MSENRNLRMGDTVVDTQNPEAVPHTDELGEKTVARVRETTSGQNRGSQLQDESAETESSVKLKVEKPTGSVTDTELEWLKRELYGERTIAIVEELRRFFRNETKAERVAALIDPKIQHKLFLHIKTQKEVQLPQDLNQRVREALAELSISEVKITKIDKNCSHYAKLCAPTLILYYQDVVDHQLLNDDDKADGILEVETVFWQNKDTQSRYAICIFPFHVLFIDEEYSGFPNDPKEYINDFNNSGPNTLLFTRKEGNREMVLLKKPIEASMTDFSPSHEEPVPGEEPEHLHFAKDIIAAEFEEYSQFKDKQDKLFVLPNQEEKVLKLTREILLRMSAANVAIYVAGWEGYMTLPIMHGVKCYHRYLAVEFLLISSNSKLKKGNCGKTIYVKRRDGERLKIAHFTAKYKHTKVFRRYRAAALSANLEGLEAILSRYMPDNDGNYDDIYEEFDHEKSIEAQFYTKDDL